MLPAAVKGLPENSAAFIKQRQHRPLLPKESFQRLILHFYAVKDKSPIGS